MHIWKCVVNNVIVCQFCSHNTQTSGAQEHGYFSRYIGMVHFITEPQIYSDFLYRFLQSETTFTRPHL